MFQIHFSAWGADVATENNSHLKGFKDFVYGILFLHKFTLVHIVQTTVHAEPL